jgi:hypothetical protein
LLSSQSCAELAGVALTTSATQPQPEEQPMLTQIDLYLGDAVIEEAANDPVYDPMIEPHRFTGAMKAWWDRWYTSYLKSLRWKQLCILVWTLQHGRCKRCAEYIPERRMAGSVKWRETHHVTYARVGYENIDDLEGLCNVCHEITEAEKHSHHGQ